MSHIYPLAAFLYSCHHTSLMQVGKMNTTIEEEEEEEEDGENKLKQTKYIACRMPFTCLSNSNVSLKNKNISNCWVVSEVCVCVCVQKLIFFFLMVKNSDAVSENLCSHIYPNNTHTSFNKK